MTADGTKQAQALPDDIEYCPYTGWPVTRIPEYEYFLMAPDHYASLSKIGDSIVCIKCRGYQGNYDAVAMDGLMEKIDDFCVRTGIVKPYVQIYDKRQETGQQSISILRREAKYFKSQQSIIIGLVFIQEASWLAKFIRLAVSLYKPSTEVAVTTTYSEAVAAARKILEAKQRTAGLKYEDVQFHPEWSYLNSLAGVYYHAGIIPGICLFQSISGTMSSPAVINNVLAAQDRMLANVRQDGWPDFGCFIIDLSDFSDTISLMTRQTYLRETAKQNAKYGVETKLRIVVTNKPLLRAASKLFFAFLGQKLLLADSLESAFALVGNELRKGLEHKEQDSDDNAASAAFTIKQQHLDELHVVFSRLLLAENDNDLRLSKDNPLQSVAETLQLIRQDIVELRQKDKENAELRLKEAQHNQNRLLDMMEDLEHAKLAVMASELRYHTLFDQSRDAMATIAPSSWHFTEGNAAALRLYGFDTLEQFQQCGPWDVSPEYQNDGRLSTEAARAMIETALREGSCYFEWIHTNLAGKLIPCSVLLNRMEISGQTILHSTVRDISEQKRARENLEKAAEKLELKNAELDVAVSKAESASRAKSEFLANMSHELRTPLNGMLGFIELLKTTALSELQQQYLDHASHSGQSLLNIINDVLDFSKIEAGMLDLELIKTDLHLLLDQSLDLVKYAAEKKQLELIRNVADAVPHHIWVDPNRLKQILANLLGNAVKFTQTGEIELRVENARNEGGRDRLIFSVRDTGIGINPEQQAKLFKAFSQADSSITRKFGGTGLGLIISDLIAKKMESKIQLDSRPGEGTRFWFDLDCRTESGQTEPLLDSLPAARCLLIEDNASARRVLEQQLFSWNLNCTSCENGYRAAEILETAGPFDVIVCDHPMPHIDGFATIKLLRDVLKPAEVHPPLILMHPCTGEEAILDVCRSLGVHFHIQKPVKSRELLDKLHRALCPSPQRASEDAQMAAPSVQAKIGFPDDSLKKPVVVQPAASGKSVNKVLPQSEASVLIVEDVAMNMTMFKSLLKFLAPGAKLHEAVNGYEALESYRTLHPDLIFMDIQMPEMDGLEATRKIRAMEQADGGHVFIAALTAGASRAEEENCRLAGMDAFLTKPVEIDKIRTVLEATITTMRPDKVPDRIPDRAPDQTPDRTPAGFSADELRLRCNNDAALYRELLSHALESFPRNLAELHRLLYLADLDGVGRLAHQIRGAALNLGCSSIASLAGQLEAQASDSTGQPGWPELLQALDQEWELVRTDMLDAVGVE